MKIIKKKQFHLFRKSITMEYSINNYKQNLITPHKQTKLVSMKSKEGCSDKKKSKTDKSYCNNEYGDSSFSTNKNKSYHHKTLEKGSDSSLVSLQCPVNNTQIKKKVKTNIYNTIKLLLNEREKKLKHNSSESSLHKEHLGKKKKCSSREPLSIEKVSYGNGTDNTSSSVNNDSTKEHEKMTIYKPSVNKRKQKYHNKQRHSNKSRIKTNLSQKINIKKHCISDISFIEQFLIQSALKKSTCQSERKEHFSEPSNAVQRKRYIKLMKKYKKYKKRKKLANEIENIQSRLLLKALEGKQAKPIEPDKNYVDPKQKPLINLKQEQSISKKDIPDLEALQKTAVLKDFNNSTIAKKHTQNRKNKLKKEKKAFD